MPLSNDLPDRVLMLDACMVAAKYSDDPRTKNGAVLVGRNGSWILSGANKLPSLVSRLPERLVAPAKGVYMEHAERAAIFQAARFGCATDGATMYCPWFACTDCARAIIEAGIAEVVGHTKHRELTDARWIDTVKQGDAMLREAGVRMRFISDQLNISYLFNGVMTDF